MPELKKFTWWYVLLAALTAGLSILAASLWREVGRQKAARNALEGFVEADAEKAEATEEIASALDAELGDIDSAAGDESKVVVSNYEDFVSQVNEGGNSAAGWLNDNYGEDSAK